MTRGGSTVSWLGLDVGGANLKFATRDSTAWTVPFPVWRRPGDLGQALAEAVGAKVPVDRVALTMTAELCDCYPTKAEGVRAVLAAVDAAFPTSRVVVWGVDGSFHDPGEIRDRPGLAAAANWLALATVAARLAERRPGVLIDVGSTTTDLIALDRGMVLARGRTDTERLHSGELVYAGVRRTPCCALATQLVFENRPTGVAAELFATTHDIFLVLGEVEEDPHDHSTADGLPATIEAARCRLARMIAADPADFDLARACALSREMDRVLLERLARALRSVVRGAGIEPEVAVISGSGEFLARRLARFCFGGRLPLISLLDRWGKEGSAAACARALVVLAEEGEEGG